MFGFIGTDRENNKPGGEIFQHQRRKKRILAVTVLTIGFILLNIILYFLTKV